MKIYFFNNKVKRFNDSLDKELKAHVVDTFGLLKERGHLIGMPYSRPLGGGLFELRIVDRIHVRFFYVFWDHNIWVLHGLIKKTNSISKQDMEYARNEYRNLLHQYNR